MSIAEGGSPSDPYAFQASKPERAGKTYLEDILIVGSSLLARERGWGRGDAEEWHH